MKIKFLRPAAVICAAAVMLSAAGCADTSWSFKTGNKTLSNGVWIYKTYGELNSAISKYQEETGDSIQITDEDFKDKKVEKKNIYDWVAEKAKDDCAEYLTLEKLIKDNKVKVDKDDIKSTEKMFASYFEQAGMNDLFVELGISSKSAAYADSITATYKEDLFKKFYDKEGTKAVSDDEVKKYFTDSYTDYYYIGYSLKTVDSEGNSVDIDDKEKETVKVNFAKYAKELNEGKKSPTEIDDEYKKDFELAEDTSVPGAAKTEKLSDSTLSENVQKEITALGEKKAVMKIIDDKYYLLYKGSISAKASKITDDTTVKDSISRLGILHEMKDDEYDKLIESEKKKLKYDKNEDCLSKYSVERTVNIIKNYVKSQSSGQ